MGHVVVIGAGLGGMSAACELTAVPGGGHGVTVVGDSGAAFVAIPQIPPRNVARAKEGKWLHFARSRSGNGSCTRCVPAVPSPHAGRS